MKKAEHFVKTRILFKDREGISAVNPQLYASRFLSAMERYFVD